MNTYKLVKAADKITWVSIDPLMYDINRSLDLLLKIPTEKMSEEDLNQLNFRIMGLQSIHSFLGALLTEQQFSDIGALDETVH